MTVSERRQVYRTKQRMNRAKRVGRLHGPWFPNWLKFRANPWTCRSLEMRQRDYARLTHAYLLKIDLDLDK